MKCLLFLSVLGFSAAFPFNNDDKIAEGNTCAVNSVPYQVSLDYGVRYNFCEGSLISDQWVVTAAHCYKPVIMVRLGKHNIDVLEETEQIISAKKIIPHPRYNPFLLDNDIMLIKLNQKALLNPSIQNISLPTECSAVGTECLISGWRNTPISGVTSPNLLQCIRAPILTDMECQNAFPRQLANNMICGGLMEDVFDSCLDVTGGPMVCDGELQGIVSWNNGCPLTGHLGVYTKVCNHLSWIQETISSN
ncbi:trypsin-like [Ranitomeya variabilis]|uniref:trypsin-like n=1 Tax=Ranitomeya variabilis TaxID=490064 RepID=UPI00405763B1